MIEVVGDSLKVSAVENVELTVDGSHTFGRLAMLATVRLAPSDSDRRRFFARLHDRAAELGVNASALTQAIADIRERLAPPLVKPAAKTVPLSPLIHSLSPPRPKEPSNRCDRSTPNASAHQTLNSAAKSESEVFRARGGCLETLGITLPIRAFAGLAQV